MHCLELTAYYTIFSSSLVYSLFRFWDTTQDYISHVDSTDFEKNSHKDVTDLEWQVTKQYYLKYKIIYLLLHSVGFYLVRRISSKHLSIFIVLYSTFALSQLIRPIYLFYICLNILLIIILSYSPFQLRKYLSYVSFMLSIMVMHNYDLETDREQNLLLQVCISWLNARGLSCVLDSESSGDWPSLNDSFTKLAYLLYFPAFLFGPIYHYTDFATMVNRLQQQNDTIKFYEMIVNSLSLCRYIYWAWMLEFSLHYIYSSLFQHYVYLTESFDSWSLCGFGFALTILFYLKYLVIYGIARAMAQLDGLRDVICKPPQCIAHMHLTSYLWRRFDRGLYSFLVRYFYKPLTGTEYNKLWRRIAAGLLSFFIVAAWHGFYKTVIVWVVLNVLLFATEIIASILHQQWSYYLENKLSKTNQLRLEAMLGAPYLALAYLSNIFFLSNYETGILFFTRIFLNDLIPLCAILFVFYSGCHVCKHINKHIKN